MLAYILISIALVIATYLALTLIPAAVIKRRLRRELIRNSRGMLALTYDDGPGPKLAEGLLKILAEHDARATFFLVGFRAERFPETAQAIAAAGHEIGNHSHWHRHAWRTLAMPWIAVRDACHGYQTMSRWMPGLPGTPFGKHREWGPLMFRPPFGELTTWIALAARQRGWPLAFWTCDGADTWDTLPDPDTVVRQIADAGGGVVLLHSHDRGEERQRYVLAVTERLLQTARERSMRVCTMSEILDATPRRAGERPRQHAASSPDVSSSS